MARLHACSESTPDGRFPCTDERERHGWTEPHFDDDGRLTSSDLYVEPLDDVADLDPHDDTRLPDGSRRVDALALAAVWRAVAGEVTRG